MTSLQLNWDVAISFLDLSCGCTPNFHMHLCIRCSFSEEIWRITFGTGGVWFYSIRSATRVSSHFQRIPRPRLRDELAYFPPGPTLRFQARIFRDCCASFPVAD